jgi:hypothetical protein
VVPKHHGEFDIDPRYSSKPVARPVEVLVIDRVAMPTEN